MACLALTLFFPITVSRVSSIYICNKKQQNWFSDLGVNGKNKLTFAFTILVTIQSSALLLNCFLLTLCLIIICVSIPSLVGSQSFRMETENQYLVNTLHSLQNSLADFQVSNYPPSSAQLAQWLSGRLLLYVFRVRFPIGTNICMIDIELFQVSLIAYVSNLNVCKRTHDARLISSAGPSLEKEILR